MTNSKMQRGRILTVLGVAIFYWVYVLLFFSLSFTLIYMYFITLFDYQCIFFVVHNYCVWKLPSCLYYGVICLLNVLVYVAKYYNMDDKDIDIDLLQIAEIYQSFIFYVNYLRTNSEYECYKKIRNWKVWNWRLC